MKITNLNLLLLMIGVAFSCQKFDTGNPNEEESLNSTKLSTCIDYVLKEPFIIYHGDPSYNTNGIVIHTYATDFVNNVEIKWGKSDDFENYAYHDMDAHHFDVPGGEDFIVWKHNWHAGTLDPNTRYYYKIHVNLALQTDKYFDGWFYTSSNNMKEFIFYAYGDSRGCGPDYANVMDAMLNNIDNDYHDRCRLLIHTGDIVLGGGEDHPLGESNHWNSGYFGRSCNNDGGDRSSALWILSHMPVLTTLGNHDFSGNDNSTNTRYYFATWPYWGYNDSSHLNPMDALEDRGWEYKDSLHKAYYSCNYGSVHFISLSTYPVNDNGHTESLSVDSKQYEWLEKDLKNNYSQWKIVFCHVPFYTTDYTNHAAVSACEPLFQKYGVDVVLQGHEHFYMRLTKDRGTRDEIPYITLGGAGASLGDLPNHYSHSDKSASKFHFAKFQVLNDSLMHVSVSEPHHGISSVDDFYIKNRLRY